MKSYPQKTNVNRNVNLFICTPQFNRATPLILLEEHFTVTVRYSYSQLATSVLLLMYFYFTRFTQSSRILYSYNIARTPPYGKFDSNSSITGFDIITLSY